MAREAVLLRVVQAGGLVILREKRGDVYRSGDARRGAVGALARAHVEALFESGQIGQVAGTKDRFLWTGGANATLPGLALPLVMRHVTPPCAACTPGKQGTAKPSASLLEAIMRRAETEDEAAYLAKAANRFLGDIEARDCTGAVTMNWDMAARGKTRRPVSAGGMAGVRLDAKRALEALADVIGPSDFDFLTAILVRNYKAKRVSEAYGIAPRAVSKHGLAALKRLAYAYDHDLARAKL